MTDSACRLNTRAMAQKTELSILPNATLFNPLFYSLSEYPTHSFAQFTHA
jgi:hypothetical protein